MASSLYYISSSSRETFVNPAGLCRPELKLSGNPPDSSHLVSICNWRPLTNSLVNWSTVGIRCRQNSLQRDQTAFQARLTITLINVPRRRRFTHNHAYVITLSDTSLHTSHFRHSKRLDCDETNSAVPERLISVARATSIDCRQ